MKRQIQASAMRLMLISALSHYEPSLPAMHIKKNNVISGSSKPLDVLDDRDNFIGETQLTYCTESRRNSSSKPVLSEEYRLRGTLLEAVNALPDYLKSMVLYCYGQNRTDWACIESVSSYVWARMGIFIESYEKVLNTQKALNAEPGVKTRKTSIKASKVEKIKSLAMSSLLHYQACVRDQKKLFTNEMLANQLMIDSKVFNRDWSPFWNQYLSILSNIDDQALSLIDFRIATKSLAA
ncbi:hypothetical protein EYS14_03490 [Alteromonadaceae bacterium M269]|nr:hypothetical protein EYS14_03490 [Alteromonadaceae bacterium M269]